jgi:hypothetical protein
VRPKPRRESFGGNNNNYHDALFWWADEAEARVAELEAVVSTMDGDCQSCRRLGERAAELERERANLIEAAMQIRDKLLAAEAALRTSEAAREEAVAERAEAELISSRRSAELEAEVLRRVKLEKALAFYADKNNWNPPPQKYTLSGICPGPRPVELDGGRKARHILKVSR